MHSSWSGFLAIVNIFMAFVYSEKLTRTCKYIGSFSTFLASAMISWFFSSSAGSFMDPSFILKGCLFNMSQIVPTRTNVTIIDMIVLKKKHSDTILFVQLIRNVKEILQSYNRRTINFSRFVAAYERFSYIRKSNI